jgi:periplasmic protein CpxP/Spy
MIRRTFVAVTSSFVFFTAAGASAQVVASPQVSAQQVPNARRQKLEQQLRQRTGEVVKRRLALSDDQMSKLQTTNRQFEVQRTDLLRRERETRQALRAELMSGDTANQARVSQLLDQQLQLQRQRIDLVQSEQRELGKFLTPVQRAKYFGLQNEIRRRAQALRNGQGAGAQGPNAQLNGARRQARRGQKQ